MNILVVEDDDKQRKTLLNLINKNFLDIKLYDSNSVKGALKYIKEKNIDLFFLDIKLPDGSGLYIAEQIREIEKYKLTPIVFTTTEEAHMLNAFKNIHCYDFLVKPFNGQEVKNIVQLFFNEKDVIKDSKYSFIKLDEELSIKVYHNDILFIEYSLRKCKIHVTSGIYIVKGISLTNLLRTLDNKDIVQTHKSYAVNLKRIHKLERNYHKSWDICFENYSERAKLGYKFKDLIPLDK